MRYNNNEWCEMTACVPRQTDHGAWSGRENRTRAMFLHPSGRDRDAGAECRVRSVRAVTGLATTSHNVSTALLALSRETYTV